MTTLTLTSDDDLAQFLALTGEPPERIAREALIVALVQRRILSRGRAAELLGMSLLDTLLFLAERGVPTIDLDDEQWEIERAASRSLSG